MINRWRKVSKKTSKPRTPPNEPLDEPDKHASQADEQPEAPPAAEPSRALFVGTLAAILILAGATAFLAIRLHDETKRQAKAVGASEDAGVRVETATVKASPSSHPLLLIGETRPFFSVTLYARVSGYMDGLFVDIGDRVKAGQKLAHVESPETEQAYNSARANAINLRHIATRARNLLRRKLISQQEAEQAFANADVAEANARTEVVLRGYQEVTAPFDGVISNRFVDPGALLQNASGSQAASQPLFTLTQADPLRVFMYVDQKDAPYVKIGDPVQILISDQTQDTHALAAKVDKIAAELDPRTRTLLVEIILPNPGGPNPGANHENRIVPGAFVQVRMNVQTPSYFELPIQALTMRAQKPFVPVIEDGGRLHFMPINLVENNGESILIRSGVKNGQSVALNVGNTLAEGQKVRPEAQQMAGTVGEARK